VENSNSLGKLWSVTLITLNCWCQPCQVTTVHGIKREPCGPTFGTCLDSWQVYLAISDTSLALVKNTRSIVRGFEAVLGNWYFNSLIFSLALALMCVLKCVLVAPGSSVSTHGRPLLLRDDHMWITLSSRLGISPVPWLVAWKFKVQLSGTITSHSSGTWEGRHGNCQWETTKWWRHPIW